MTRIKQLLLLALITFSIGVSAQNCFPEKPSKQRLVNDLAGMFTAQEINLLEEKLVNFNDTTSTQIAVITVLDLCDYEASSFAFELGEKWGIGNAEFDNGIVVLFKPKTNDSKGQIYIATGYGLEGVLPDAIGKRIVENEMIPLFKQGAIYQGINRGTSVIMDIVGGEYSSDAYQKGSTKPVPIFPFIFVLFIIFIFIFSAVKRAKTYSLGHNVSLWTALFLMGSSTRSHGGSWNNFHSGSGGFGGGGGGGFGGFGGGSFGGGGAGGSW
jgi:uncharacterized protein